MVAMTPSAARDFWHALVRNAADLVIEADLLYPSPRTQSLIVLAHEELGKASWVSSACRRAWREDDHPPVEVPELQDHGRRHVPKLAQAYEFLADDEARFVLTGDGLAEWEADRLAGNRQWAVADNVAKQKGFYVDLEESGEFTVPSRVERPALSYDLWEVAHSVLWAIADDSLRASRPRLDFAEDELRLKQVSDRHEPSDAG
ncbi:AbiV family abortive infection protein [Demequina sp. SYSU T00068]|uniref:AbiV family abortive infection protein n=1 Tax=Demequina lignilytica TaxID=3051663 RepID=UPI002610AA5C|nr:AbiV family abortive infection protein [Demequina sp. SYSU T00068]MDN4491580.1 AbiV family abortive infection protein [Demequina sp. SYSU T00068]